MNARRAWLARFWPVLWLVFAVAGTLALLAQLPAARAALDAREIALAEPRWLWLGLLAWLPPLAVRWSLTDLPRWQQGLQAIVRMALIVGVACVLAGPQRREQAALGVHVVHVVDRSESVPDELLRAAERDGLAATARAARAVADDARVKADVVAFDGRATRLPWDWTATTDEGQPSVPRIERGDAARETDLEHALNASMALLDPDRIAHVVLWTDGVETRGDARALGARLAAAGVRVHAPKLPELPASAELLLDRFEVPARIRANVPFPLAIDVETTGPATVVCRASGAGQQTEPVEARLVPGRQRIELGKLRFRDDGAHDIEARCDVKSGTDRFANNNRLRGRVVVETRPRVLYVEGARGQSPYLARALVDDFELTVRDADGLPRRVDELAAYDVVVLSDVPRVSTAGVPLVTDGDMRNLHRYVEGGGGLLVLGGEGSLGSGGYQNTYLDKHVLPVSMEIESQLQTATAAMMLVIDRSGSMNGIKIALAKEAARATAKLLADEDRIGVIAFDNVARTQVRLQRAGNRYRVAQGIDSLTAGGGTHILPALQQAYRALSSVAARVKHVILLSDGQAPRAGIDAEVRRMGRSGITVSTVGIGAEVDRPLLEMIADRGSGRSYFTDRPETLPRIFVRETKKITGESVVEQRVRARRAPGVGREAVLRAVRIERAPPLLGFLPAKTKRGAEELLRLDNGSPLLVRWARGKGKVAVFTSDLKNRWAHEWLGWRGYPILARQMVRDCLEEDRGMHVDVRLARSRDQLRVAVDAVDVDGTYLRGLVGEARVRLPSGQVRELALPEVAEGRYEVQTPMDALGAWDVEVLLRGGPGEPPIASGRATAMHPYPDEHRIGDASASPLDALVKATGGAHDATAAAWLDDAGKTRKSWRPLWPRLSLWLVLLLGLDVLLRRVRLGRALRRSWYATAR